MQFWLTDRTYRQRLRQILTTLARHGLGWLVLELGLGRPLPFRRLKGKGRPASGPEHFRAALEDLGATFIKMGQVLSTRPDILPPDYIAEFAKLQDAAPPVDYDAIASVLEDDLGAPPDELFGTFSREPVASASIGQVHAAELPDGTSVVVKVQRPRAFDIVERDLDILRDIAHLAVQRTQWAQDYDIEGWFREFAFTLRNEFDYTVEASNAEHFAREFRDDDVLYVPRVYRSFSARRVLTLERIEGIKISDVDALDRAGIDRKQLARESARILITMVFEHGFFHADPHAGNFFVMKDQRIGLMDYGMVGFLDAYHRDALLRIMIALPAQDADRLVDEMLVMGVARDDVRRYTLRQDVQHLMRRYAHKPLKEIEARSAFQDLMNVARRHHLRMPAELVLTAKVMGMAEGVAAQLDPDFDVMSFAEPHVKRFWLHALSPPHRVDRAKETLLDLLDLTETLPRSLRRILRQSEQGSLQFNVQTEHAPEALRQIQRAANRVAFSVLTAALIVGSGLLMLAYDPAGAQWFFLVTFAAAAFLGIGLLWSVWRSGRF
ncbi:MAG: AarF/ABC1/UbiB kinase family protein [Rhodothermales bacterium]